MFGLCGLQQRQPLLFHPSGPTRHLPHQLKRAFCRAQVGPLQAQIGINHPDQGQQRKVVPLGHHLRADDDVTGPRRDFLDLLLQRAGRAEQVRRQHRHAGVGKQRAHFFVQPLDPGTDGGQPSFGLAGGAFVGHRFGFAALVAHQALLEPVLHHPRIAMITTNLVPTGPTHRCRRVTTAVDKQQRLFPLRHPRRHRIAQAWRNPTARRNIFGPQINRPHVRHLCSAKTRRQLDPFILARLRIGPCFKRWRGRGQHHLRRTQRRAQNHHVAGIIDHAIFLFVGGIVFLIHHHQPQIAERQEQGGSCAHHQPHIALACHFPQAAALNHGDAGMPFAGAGTKAVLDPFQKFRSQGDLGQQHQRLPSLAQTFGHGFQIDLGLARSGDAFQQGGAICAADHSITQHIRRRGLIRRQVHAVIIRVQRRIGQIARAVLFPHHALFHQPLDHRGRHTGLFRQFAQREGQAAIIRQHLQHTSPRVGFSVGCPAAQPEHLAHCRRIAQPRRAGRQPQHHRQRRHGILGRPCQKLAHFTAHRGHIQHADHTARFLQVKPAAPPAPDHTNHLARAQRHLDKSATHAATLGGLVIQQPVNRLRGQNRHQRAFVEKTAIRHALPRRLGLSAPCRLR